MNLERAIYPVLEHSAELLAAPYYRASLKCLCKHISPAARSESTKADYLIAVKSSRKFSCIDN